MAGLTYGVYIVNCDERMIQLKYCGRFVLVVRSKVAFNPLEFCFKVRVHAALHDGAPTYILLFSVCSFGSRFPSSLPSECSACKRIRCCHSRQVLVASAIGSVVDCGAWCGDDMGEGMIRKKHTIIPCE